MALDAHRPMMLAQIGTVWELACIANVGEKRRC